MLNTSTEAGAGASLQRAGKTPAANQATTTVIDGAQAYADLLPRIQELSSKENESLATAMAELSRALHQNPNAVALMLPEDIGQMVAALRRMVGISIATETKAPKKAASTSAKAGAKLSAAQIQAAFDEL